MKKVYVATDYHEKQLQRALLQYNRPQNADLVREALTKAGRTDLIGHGKDCLVRPAGNTAPRHTDRTTKGDRRTGNARPTATKKSANTGKKTERTAGKQTRKPQAKVNKGKKRG